MSKIQNIETILEMTLLEDIGGDEGKNSFVKKSYDHQLDAFFAVKVIEKDSFIQEFGDDHRNMFFHESKKIYGSRHSNIVEIQHATSCDNNVYFTMPFYENGSLNKVINNRYLTVREIVKISLEFLSGLHYIHTKNLVHFDIKPTNVMINNNGKAMLTDFGLARYTDGYGIAKFSKVYRSHYPPECIDSNIMTKQADIYQAGLTLYRMCNGNLNFMNQYKGHMNKGGSKLLFDKIKKERFPARDYLPHIPSKLKRIVNKSLRINPDDRHHSVLDLMNEIAKVDCMLDIRFSMTEDMYTWERDNSKNTHTEIINVNIKDDSIGITGMKRNNKTLSTTNIKSLNVKEVATLNDAFKIIEKYLTEK